MGQLVHCCANMVGVRTFEKMFLIPGAHWNKEWGTLGLYVSKGEQKQNGRQLYFLNKVQTKNVRQPACKMNYKLYCQNNIRVK